jgi:hypothetical protein
VASDFSHIESDRATDAFCRCAAIADRRSFSMVESRLSRDRKSIVVALGILGMDAIAVINSSDGLQPLLQGRDPIVSGCSGYLKDKAVDRFRRASS